MQKLELPGAGWIHRRFTQASRVKYNNRIPTKMVQHFVIKLKFYLFCSMLVAQVMSSALSVAQEPEKLTRLLELISVVTSAPSSPSCSSSFLFPGQGKISSTLGQKEHDFCFSGTGNEPFYPSWILPDRSSPAPLLFSCFHRWFVSAKPRSNEIYALEHIWRQKIWIS